MCCSTCQMPSNRHGENCSCVYRSKHVKVDQHTERRMEKMLLLCVSGCAPTEFKQQVVCALLEADHPARFTQKKLQNSSPFDLLLDSHDAPLTNAQHTPYDLRFVWTPESTPDEVVAEVRCLLDARRFTSTRGMSVPSETFLGVVREGMAPDGGLFNMQHIPRMAASQLRHFCTTPTLSYVDGAQFVLERLVDRSIQPRQLHALLLEAYHPSRWCGLRDVCPVTPLTPNAASSSACYLWQNMSLLELYHGPTAAFKDFALQLFPRYFNLAVENEHRDKETPLYIILAATSGDTGVAAISGFINSISPSRVMVLYPVHGVSPVQQVQMLSYDNGTSVRVFGVESDFDFCQRAVKTLFADRVLAEKLWTDTRVRLSSANSINWGRLIPQVVYYFWAYRQLVQQQQGLQLGEPLDVVVPCGNFGNILAAFFAKRMGLPLGTLVVASNRNDVLYEFLRTGCYDIRGRQLVPTASPSIDILKASNVERFLFLLSNGDAEFVAAQMHKLETQEHFFVQGDALETMRKEFWSSRCNEVECATTIKEMYDASGRLLDTHTAVAVFAAKKFRQYQQESALPERSLLIVSTAHWAKFPGPVLRALRGEDMADDRPSGEEVSNPVQACRALYDEILLQHPNITVHPALNAALTAAESMNVQTRTIKADVSCAQDELMAFASSCAGRE